MASSNQGGRTGGNPGRSIGRSFASIDPERVREVPGDGRRVASNDHQTAGARNGEASRVVRGQPVEKQGANQGGSQGGSGGR